MCVRHWRCLQRLLLQRRFQHDRLLPGFGLGTELQLRRHDGIRRVHLVLQWQQRRSNLQRLGCRDVRLQLRRHLRNQRILLQRLMVCNNLSVRRV